MPTFDLSLQADFKFQALFNQLGWDRPPGQQPFRVDVEDQSYELAVVAHKRGVQILHCLPGTDGQIPPYAIRQKIDRKITPEAREHLIIFTDHAQTAQVWQWVARRPDRPNQYREIRWQRGDSSELLRQKLSSIAFTLEDEEFLLVSDITRRLAGGFDRDKVTKKFYGEFDKQRQAFTDFIAGIPLVGREMHEDQRWYAAVLIDRLMFLWFLQEKGFLDGKKQYLQTRLQEHVGRPAKESFYRTFLSPLFFRGFAEARTATNRASIEAEFGYVPYLNGGLFAQHELERKYGDALDVEDAAFTKLFGFFNQWDWHLDDRPLGSGKEINPDVLGYIFEKFVNQKQMGAYYTKEDITDYIGKNTIIPCLLAKVRAEHPGAFDALAWGMLQESGDTYIYPAMLKGVDLVYPADIAVGLDTKAPDLLARRKAWNKRAADAASLPTEIWREAIARHQRTREVRAKIAAGELREIGELITYNLDIRLFAQHLIERCTDLSLLKSFWFALAGRLPQKSNEKYRHGLSVLDPTCGSGAFLLAALQILKPLYDATLRTLHALRNDVLMTGQKTNPASWKEIDAILRRFSTDKPDRMHDYAVIKHIIVHNLYGVDIEEQATEIAKLRLFLKLVALLEPGDDIEPLPDIDFNIRHGNTLIGYASEAETECAVKGASQQNLFSDAWEDIRVRLTRVEQEYNNFQIQQVQLGGHVSVDDKRALEQTLGDLEETLNYHLAKEYGVDPHKTAKYDAWKASHQPFHWFVDFYPLMARGGFDAVIGNPPWLEFQKIEEPRYGLKRFQTLGCNNLWAFVVERSLEIGSQQGHLGLIVPMSLVSTDRMLPVQKLVSGAGKIWLSNYESDSNPGQLFEGVKQNVSILVCARATALGIHTTRLQRFFSDARGVVFSVVQYAQLPPETVGFGFAKIGSSTEASVLKKLFQHAPLSSHRHESTATKVILVHRIAHYFIKCFDFVPFFSSERDGQKKSEDYKEYRLEHSPQMYVAVINSSTFYFYWQVFFDAFKAGKHCVEMFPIGCLSAQSRRELTNIGAELSTDLRRNSQRLIASYKTTGRVEYDQFFPRKSKGLMDLADVELAKHFGLSLDELDTIVHYDIKFRVSESSGEYCDD